MSSWLKLYLCKYVYVFKVKENVYILHLKVDENICVWNSRSKNVIRYVSTLMHVKDNENLYGCKKVYTYQIPWKCILMQVGNAFQNWRIYGYTNMLICFKPDENVRMCISE